MLLTNFKNKEQALIQIAIQASGLTNYHFGEAYNIIGGLIKDMTGLYVDDIYSKSLEGQQHIELFFKSYLIIIERLLELKKERETNE